MKSDQINQVIVKNGPAGNYYFYFAVFTRRSDVRLTHHGKFVLSLIKLKSFLKNQQPQPLVMHESD